MGDSWRKIKRLAHRTIISRQIKWKSLFTDALKNFYSIKLQKFNSFFEYFFSYRRKSSIFRHSLLYRAKRASFFYCHCFFLTLWKPKKQVSMLRLSRGFFSFFLWKIPARSKVSLNQSINDCIVCIWFKSLFSMKDSCTQQSLIESINQCINRMHVSSNLFFSTKDSCTQQSLIQSINQWLHRMRLVQISFFYEGFLHAAKSHTINQSMIASYASGSNLFFLWRIPARSKVSYNQSINDCIVCIWFKSLFSMKDSCTQQSLIESINQCINRMHVSSNPFFLFSINGVGPWLILIAAAIIFCFVHLRAHVLSCTTVWFIEIKKLFCRNWNFFSCTRRQKIFWLRLMRHVVMKEKNEKIMTGMKTRETKTTLENTLHAASRPYPLHRPLWFPWSRTHLDTK